MKWYAAAALAVAGGVVAGLTFAWSMGDKLESALTKAVIELSGG